MSIAVRRLVADAARVSYVAFAVAAVAHAAWLNRAYQDSWILEGIWPEVAGLILAFLVIALVSDDLAEVAAYASATAVLLAIAPAIKYREIYGIAIDNGAHLALVRAVLTGQPPGQPHPYGSSPAFHGIIAGVAGASGSGIVTWAKILPGLLGAVVPLAYYWYCRQRDLPFVTARLTIAMSTFSLPASYWLNGTTFSAPLVVVVVAVVAGSGGKAPLPNGRAGGSLAAILLMAALQFWHPSTALVLPGALLLAAVLRHVAFGKAGLPAGRGGGLLGVIGISMTLAYWMFESDFMWGIFARQIWQLLQMDFKTGLVPLRFFDLNWLDRGRILLLMHARDMLLLALAFVGGVLILRRGGNLAGQRGGLALHASIWMAFLGLLAAVFLVDYAQLGYHRFLFYVVALAPPLAATAGSALRQAGLSSRASMGPFAEVAALATVALAHFMQVYPFQPFVPVYVGASGDETPVVWMHQVNTAHQRAMLEFADERLPEDRQLVADFAGQQQVSIFGITGLEGRVRRTEYQSGGPTYFMMHLPGAAGPMAEQAQFRSEGDLQSWKAVAGASTVYDNGGSFILYHRDNPILPFLLGSHVGDTP